MRARGFTIIELMVVILIGSILASYALPEMKQLIVRVRLKTAATDLHTSLLYARAEAIKRNAAIDVVPADTSDWSRGWSVRQGATVLTRQDGYSGLAFAPRNAAYGTKTVTSVTFSGNGRESSTDGLGIAFVLTSSAYSNISARCVVLDPSGRPTVRIDRDDDPSDGCN